METTADTPQLFALVDRIATAVQRIIRFRMSPTAHDLWRPDVEPLMRRNLLDLVLEEREAERGRVAALSDLMMMEEGKCLVATPTHLRSPKAMKARHARADARYQNAVLALKANWKPICRMQCLLAARKQAALGQDLRVHHQQFEAEHARHAIALAAARHEVAVVGPWQGACYCEVLGAIAGDLMSVLDSDANNGDYMARWIIEQRLRTISHEDWTRLRNVAKKEAAALPASSDGAPPRGHYRFRRSGVGHWDICFAGTGQTVPHSKGMAYIRTLLANPGKRVHSWTLVHKEPPPEDAPEPILNDQALESLRSTVAQLSEQREASVDNIERAELEEKIAAIQKYFAADTRPTSQGRVSRFVRNPAEDNRNACGKAMRTALHEIARACPPLGGHLGQHLNSPTGMQPMYSCPDDVRPSWDLGPDYPE